ncbi:N-acetyltransferase family protein [Holzapfeliella sp. He02]|uniref:N-acetyltransferase family protein n=1 Tax=Holzapfeliella saturejae TaxID=3082953 RepID=A0ABU8SEC2_9LACO
MHHIDFKLAEKSDLPEVIRIYNQGVLTQKAAPDVEVVTVDEKKDWFNQHLGTNHPLWVIRNQNQEVMGWVSLSKMYDRLVYDISVEISIYIDEAFQGQGLATKAITFCEKKAQELGYQNIVALIFSHNEASKHLFEKNNYQHYGNYPDIAKIKDKIVSVDIYGKKI